MDANEVLAQYIEGQNKLNSDIADKLKTVGNDQTANKLHGTGGLFSTPGLERDVITAHVRPFGIGAILPLLPTVTEDPRFPSLTGFTATVGSQPTAPCADAPYAYMKGANLTARLGMLRFDTSVIDIGKTMLQINRGEMRDLVLRGRILGENNMAPSEINEAGMLDIMTKSEMVIAGVSAERELVKQIWQGTLSVAGNFPGLDVQVATGQIDADTQTAAPALDSDIKSFAYNTVGGSGLDIVEYLSSMVWYLENNARTMGLDPVEFVIAMNPNLWQELTAVWPIVYNTNRVSALQSARGTVMIDGRENISERDAMRQSMTIQINGKEYRVITDNGIFEHNNINNANLKAGEYASSIYVLPLTINGNFPVLYREYLDFSRASANSDLLRGMNTFWTDNGIYTWAIEQNKWCYKLALRTEQRVILRTPHLAGKLQYVKYSPLQHLRDADPASAYFKDGGVSLRGWTRGKAVWG